MSISKKSLRLEASLIGLRGIFYFEIVCIGLVSFFKRNLRNPHISSIYPEVSTIMSRSFRVYITWGCSDFFYFSVLHGCLI